LTPNPPFFLPLNACPPELPQENLKILKQYGKLVSQACAEAIKTKRADAEHDPLAAHVQPLSPTPNTFPRNLQWFQDFARPFQHLTDQARARVLQLLELKAASTSQPFPTAPALQCELAASLIQELPHFDRDLVAFALLTPIATALPRTELDLFIAHSLLKTNPTSSTHLLLQQTPWRHQGLVHVLSVAAFAMPTLPDWFPINTPSHSTDEDARALHHFLELHNADPSKYESGIDLFIAALGEQTSPTSQAIMCTLDRLAILMGVKSNAEDEHDHSLHDVLATFPRLESLEPQDVWASIKPALERAIPPSLLRVEPTSSCIRKRVKKHQTRPATGTWCAKLHPPPHTHLQAG